MSYENDYLRLPGIWGSKEKLHDPEKATSYHEAGHTLCRLYSGLIPESVSIIGYQGTGGYCSAEYYPGCDFGINWQVEGPEYTLIWLYGGIIAKAWYSGVYEWNQVDLQMAQQIADQFDIDFDGQMKAWERTHEVIESLADLLERAAEDLYRSKVLDAHYFERLLFNLNI